MTEAGADEVHLVLSSVAAARTLEQTAERFAAVGATSLILTKLDEANGLGNVLPLLRSSGLPLSYLTDGQNVPDDIEIGRRPPVGADDLGDSTATSSGARNARQADSITVRLQLQARPGRRSATGDSTMPIDCRRLPNSAKPWSVAQPIPCEEYWQPNAVKLAKHAKFNASLAEAIAEPVEMDF